MRNRLLISGFSVIAGLSSINATAQTTNGAVGPVSYAVPFLTIAPDARSGAMGDVGIALSPDANSQHWNIAKVANNESDGGVSFTYSPWLKDIVPDVFLGYVSGYKKFGKENNQAVSASFRYFNLGEIGYKNIVGEDMGTGKPYELAFDVGYSRKLSENLSVGVAMRLINSNIAAGASSVDGGGSYKAATTVAADLGVYYTKPIEQDDDHKHVLALGAILRNIGGKVTYSQQRRDYLPATLGIGGAYTHQIDRYSKITGALDLNKMLVPAAIANITSKTDPNTGTTSYDTSYTTPTMSVVSGIFNSFGKTPGMYGTTVSVGAEYWYQDQFAARVGYFYEAEKLGNRKYFACGVGVRYNVFGLDVSYIVPSGSSLARNPLSNTLRFTLSFDFMKDKKEKTPKVDVAPKSTPTPSVRS